MLGKQENTRLTQMAFQGAWSRQHVRGCDRTAWRQASCLSISHYKAGKRKDLDSYLMGCNSPGCSATTNALFIN